MGQLTIYLPADLEKKVKDEARRARQSVSGYIASLLVRDIRPTKWPKWFRDLAGSWEGPFPEIRDLPLDKRERLR